MYLLYGSTPATDNDTRFIKPGLCPVTVPALDSWFSSENCTIDDNCVGNKKCCSFPHGKKCISPQQQIIQPIRGLDSKPGVCPSPTEVRGLAAQACFKDKDCPSNFKCCEDVGGLFCRNSLPEPAPFNPSLNQPIWPTQITTKIFDRSCLDVNEEFQNCGTPCPASCQDQSQPLWCPTPGCVPGCFCRRSFTRKTKDFGAPCVPENQCPITRTTSDNATITTGHVPPCTTDQSCRFGQKCCKVPQPLTFLEQRFCLCADPNAIWSDCGPICTDICSRGQITRDNCQWTSQPCRPGCFCLPGYIRMTSETNNEQCIRRHLCSLNSTNLAFDDNSQQLVVLIASHNLNAKSRRSLHQNGQIQGLKPSTTYFLELHENGNFSGDFCHLMGDVVPDTQARQALLYDRQTAKPLVNLSVAAAINQIVQKVAYATTPFVSDLKGKLRFSLVIDGDLDRASNFFNTNDSQTSIGRSLTLNEKSPDLLFNNNNTEIIACGVISFVQNVS
uniref:WAP domain-containing protein n=1 Tax=Romanomermis culicivorax TaxID=13658 RepID=A0A915HNI0_ROMCU